MSINVNTASREDLIAVRGIGEELADAIILRRPFGSIEDLLRIPGIGPVSLERLKEEGLYVGEPPQEPRDGDRGQPFRMSIPGFNAEASLYRTSGHYRMFPMVVFVLIFYDRL